MSSQALASLLPLPVALPLAGAVAAPLLARLHRRLAVIVGLVALGGSTVILLLQAPSVFAGLVRAHYLGLWTPVHGQALGHRVRRRPVRPDLRLDRSGHRRGTAAVHAVGTRRPGAARAGRLCLPVPVAGRRADRGGADRRPVQPVRLVRGRRAGQLRAHRVLPGAPDRAGGRLQDPGADHAGQLRRVHRRRAALRRQRRAQLRPASCRAGPASDHARCDRTWPAGGRVRDEGRARPVPRLAG